LLWCLAVLYLLGTGAFYFVGGIEGRQRKVELVCEGCSRGGGFVVWMERGTPEEGGIGPGRDSVGGYY